MMDSHITNVPGDRAQSLAAAAARGYCPPDPDDVDSLAACRKREKRERDLERRHAFRQWTDRDLTPAERARRAAQSDAAITGVDTSNAFADVGYVLAGEVVENVAEVIATAEGAAVTIDVAVSDAAVWFMPEPTAPPCAACYQEAV